MHQISFPAFAAQTSTRAGVNSKGSVGPLLADGPPACNLHVLPPQRYGGNVALEGGHCLAIGLRSEFFDTGDYRDAAYMDAPGYIPRGSHRALTVYDGLVVSDGYASCRWFA